MDRFLIPPCLVPAVFLALNSCVHPSTHQTALAERNHLRTENFSLRQSNQQLAEKLASQSEDKNGTESALRDLRNQVEIQAGDLEVLSDRNLKLSQEVDRLSRHKRELLDSLESSKVEVEAYKEELADLSQKAYHAELLGEKVAALQSASDALSAELKHVRSVTHHRVQKEEKQKEILQNIAHELNELFEEEIGGRDVSVAAEPGSVTLRMGEAALFGASGLELSPGGTQLLDRLAKVLKPAVHYRIEVQGHTDDVPIGAKMADIYPTNWEWSAVRAGRVTRYLAENTDIDSDRLVLAGYADTRPVTGNETAAGRQMNRRIEITLYPIGDRKPLSQDGSPESEVHP
jgi:chemotaxis protein MotB